MGCALALPLVASLAAAASADLGLDLRAQSRTSTVAPEGFAPYTREALLARPGATLVLDAVPLRLSGRYVATIWTSDVEASPSPLVTQDAHLRVETRHASPWRAGATASAARGWTDPLADPVQALPVQGPSQSPALAPIEFEAFRAAVDASVPLDRRTTIGWDAAAWRSGAVRTADRVSLPLQDGATAQLAVEHLMSLRSGVRIAVGAFATRTELAEEQEDSGWMTGTARWRVRMTHTLDAWAGAGVAMSNRDVGDGSTERWVRPLGEIGLAYTGARGAAELSALSAPFTDRFTGEVTLMFQGTGALSWRESPRLSFRAAASGGSTASRDTALAALDARGIYVVSERLSLEAGIVGRWQRERAGTAPSFAEIGLVVALAWDSTSFRR